MKTHRYIYLVAALLTWLGAAGRTLRVGSFAESCGWNPGDSAVIIPAHVKAIPDFAFADIRELADVSFAPGSRLSKVGSHAFLGCSGLRRIELPASVGVLGEGCFRDCSSLREIAIPGRVREIPAQAFRGCGKLRSVTLPSGLREIRPFAFIYCASLEAIDIPRGVRRIGNNAFSCCSSLREVSLPDGVSSLESYAFSDCTSLRKVRLPDNPGLLGELIFSGCESLREIEQPAAVPPRFDCDSYLFEPEDSAAYARCRLRVPQTSAEAYGRAAGWRLMTRDAPRR